MHTPICSLPTRQQALSCIIFFDSGSSDIDPEEPVEVLAVSTGNSSYVPSFILSDPAKIVPEYEFRHTVKLTGRLPPHQNPFPFSGLSKTRQEGDCWVSGLKCCGVIPEHLDQRLADLNLPKRA